MDCAGFALLRFGTCVVCDGIHVGAVLYAGVVVFGFLGVAFTRVCRAYHGEPTA